MREDVCMRECKRLKVRVYKYKSKRDIESYLYVYAKILIYIDQIFCQEYNLNIFNMFLYVPLSYLSI